MKPLTKLRSGETAFIAAILNDKLSRTFYKHGILPGDLIEVKENPANCTSLLVHVRNRTFNIYRSAAETVITNAVSTEFSMN